MNRLKQRLHDRGIHRFCRTVPTWRRVFVGYDHRARQWFVGRDGTKIDATPFGGVPVYRTVLVRVHR